MQDLEGSGGWQRTEALCVSGAQGREKGRFFCGLALAWQRCLVRVVPHLVVHVLGMENPAGNILE